MIIMQNDSSLSFQSQQNTPIIALKNSIYLLSKIVYKGSWKNNNDGIIKITFSKKCTKPIITIAQQLQSY